MQFKRFNGSFRVKINGVKLPALDQLAFEYDVGSYVKSGSNTIEIEVAGSLLNRMRVLFPSAYGSRGKQGFGLLGVTIQPYRQVQIA